jgi:phage tail sheath gpL-like
MAIKTILTITSEDLAANMIAKIQAAQSNEGAQPSKLANYFAALGAGYNKGTLLVEVGAVQATGTVTLASVTAADTVTINGVVLTAVSGAPAAGEFDISGTDTADAVSFCAAVAANATLAGLVTATSVLGVVTLTAIRGGVSGNAITLASSNGGRLAVSAARLASGTDGTAVTYNFGT